MPPEWQPSETLGTHIKITFPFDVDPIFPSKRPIDAFSLNQHKSAKFAKDYYQTVYLGTLHIKRRNVSLSMNVTKVSYISKSWMENKVGDKFVH